MSLDGICETRLTFEFVFSSRNKSFNRLQIYPFSRSINSEFGEIFLINLIKGNRRVGVSTLGDPWTDE
jgi:hypothetical protein